MSKETQGEQNISQSRWIVYFENIRAIRPDEFNSFLKILTEFVELFPTDASILTIEDVESILVET